MCSWRPSSVVLLGWDTDPVPQPLHLLSSSEVKVDNPPNSPFSSSIPLSERNTLSELIFQAKIICIYIFMFDPTPPPKTLPFFGMLTTVPPMHSFFLDVWKYCSHLITTKGGDGQMAEQKDERIWTILWAAGFTNFGKNQPQDFWLYEIRNLLFIKENKNPLQQRPLLLQTKCFFFISSLTSVGTLRFAFVF